MSMRFHQAKSCQQLLPSTLLHSTNCCLLNVFLDDSSSRLPGYARDTFRARWAFVICLCNSSSPHLQKRRYLWFSRPAQGGGICDLRFMKTNTRWGAFVIWICNFGRARALIVHDDSRTYHLYFSTLFRILSGSSRIQKKRRSVTFCQVEFRCTQNENKQTRRRQITQNWKPFWIPSSVQICLLLRQQVALRSFRGTPGESILGLSLWFIWNIC